jgi:hypothetical protein
MLNRMDTEEPAEMKGKIALRCWRLMKISLMRGYFEDSQKKNGMEVLQLEIEGFSFHRFPPTGRRALPGQSG